MDDFSILIGGKAGFGIDKASLVIAGLINRLGYRIYVYRDYPSLIRGGHTFSIIRCARERIASHRKKVDVILALNQDAIDLHEEKRGGETMIIYDSGSAKTDVAGAMAIPLTDIVKEEGSAEITRNSGMVGAFARAMGIPWEDLDAVFRKSFTKEIDENLKIARRGFDSARQVRKVEKAGQAPLPVISGNEAISLGLIKAGLQTYIAYPMTPSSPILHFLAALAPELGMKVIHPESEIAVMLMAAGFAYCGEKVAVGTSGGGFCLMTEGFSFSAMAELPVVAILGQRPGPSTGLPTYSSQTELGFALNAGHGEFARLVVAPGDTEEAYYWPQVVLNMSWKYRIPSIILTDKNLGEGTYNMDLASVKDVPAFRAEPLFPPVKDKAIKTNSYEHDESGITTEDPAVTTRMQDKRLEKERLLSGELKDYECVKVYGNERSPDALLCWGSNKGVCLEVSRKTGLKVAQVLVMSPFPKEQFERAVSGVKNLIAVENNATGQLARLVRYNGFKVDHSILKYDGRPFSVDELEERVRGSHA